MSFQTSFEDTTVQLLKGQANIKSWKLNFRAVAEAKGLWEYFETDQSKYAIEPVYANFVKPIPRETRKLASEESDSSSKDTYDKLSHKLALQKHEKYLKNNSKAWGLIKLSVEPSIREQADSYNTPKKYYDWIIDYFQPKDAVFQQLLFAEFDRLKLAKCIDMQDFISKITATAQRIKDCGGEIAESQVKAKMITGLTDEYSHFVDSFFLLSDDKRSSVDQIAKLLINQEFVLKQRQTKPAMTANSVLNNPKDSEPRERPQRSRCTTCGRMHGPGCFVETGRIPEGWSNEGKDWLRRKIEEFKQKNRQAQTDSNQENSKDPKEKKEKNLIATMAYKVTQQELQPKDWILDSGANAHYCNDINLFVEYSENQSSATRTADLMAPDLSVRGIGKVKLEIDKSDGNSNEFLISDVYYAPTVRINILSPDILLSKSGIYGKWTKQGTILMNKDGDEIASAIRWNKVWKLQVQNQINEEKLPMEPMVNTLTDEPVRLKQWHRRLGHLNYESVKKLAPLSDGMDLTEFDLNWKQSGLCQVCTEGKLVKHLPPESQSRASKPLELVHSDYWGPYTAEGLAGKWYYVTLIDDHTRNMWIETTNSRTSKQLTKIMEPLIEMLENQTGHKVKRWQTDGAKEFKHGEFKAFLKRKGIQWQPTIPYAPHQNGVAERANRTIASRIRTIRLDSGLPDYLWRELAKTAVYLINRSPTRCLEGKTPYEAWYGKKPDLLYLKIIGSVIYCLNVETKVNKLDPVARKCRLIGYGPGSNQYRVWNPETTEIKDVTFVKVDETDYRVTDSNIALTENIGTDEIDPYEQTDDEESDSSGSNAESDNDNQTMYESEQGLVRKPKQTVEVVIPKRKPFTHHVTHMPFAADGKSIVHEPTYQEALNSDEAEYWKKAILDEYNSLIQNQTWDLVRLPKGRKALPAKWVLCHKLGSKGEIVRWKARWVAKGFLQRYGIDFDQIWASVVKTMTYKMLLAFATANHWYIRQGDIKTAFLNGDIHEDIYVIQPIGFEIMDEEGNPLVCKLRKALYGLKQSARVWYEKARDTLIKLGLIPIPEDQSVFISADKKLILALYVDDLLYFGKTEERIQEMEAALAKEFVMTNLGESNYYLGMNVIYDRTKGICHLHQTKYINQIVARSGLGLLKSVKTPMQAGQKLTKAKDQIASKEDILRYCSLVGSINYLAVMTRPDISYAVSHLSQFMTNPTKEHFDALKRVYAYVNATKGLGLTYQTDKPGLTGYVDADWAGNVSDRKSTTGYVYIYRGSPISWASKRQQCIALSTAEAEYVAASEAAKEGLWLKTLHNVFNQPENQLTTITMREDNEGCIKIGRNPELHPRTKHIDIRYHFLREHVIAGNINLDKISGSDQIADGLTKALPREAFERFVAQMGLTYGPN